MLAHISMRGNVPGQAGQWLGEPGSGLEIEALILARAAEGPPHLAPAVEYQLIYPKGLKTPWTPAGQPCGSAGLGLGCVGIRFRLTAETAAYFACTYDIAFTDGTRQDGVRGTDIAVSPSGAAVEAIRLHVTQREAVPLIVLNDVVDPPAAEETGPQDDPTIRLRLLSPAFATAAPEIRNAALIPPVAGRAMAPAFNRRIFAGQTVTLRLVEEATVVGEGAVFDRDLKLVPGAIRLQPDNEAQHRALAQQGQNGQIRRIAGLSILCKSSAPYNYGHFLMDMFPKAWLAARVLSRRNLTYIVQQNDILPVAQDALTMIGINPYAISATDSWPVRCEQLVIVDGLTHHGTYQSPISVQALTELGASIPAAPYKKIFVSRDAKTRPLHNQEAVQNLLRERGFAIVDPGQMTLAEQISLFKGATTVVGPLGAALTNTVFCPPGSKIVALTAQSFPDTFFWFLAQHRGHDYQEVRGLDVSGDA